MSYAPPAARRAARGRVRRRLLVGAALLASPTLAVAQTSVRSPTVAEVIVTARPDPEDPPVVADTRRRLSETPGGVSVIAAESYESRFATGLDDTLRDAPGVYAQRKWGGDIRISIRGSGIGNANHNRGLLIAQDGLPLNEADGFGDSQLADPLTTRLVEVYRGGNALRFGGALLGGAVNLVTPTGADAGYEGRVRIDGGSFGLIREHLAAARDLGEWDAYAGLTNQTGQGFRPQSQQNLQFASVNVGRSFGDEREIRLIVNGADIKQEIPGALTRAQFGADPEQPAPSNYAGDYARDQRGMRGSLRARWRLNDHVALDAAVYAIWKDLDHPIFQVIDQQSRNYGAFVRVDLDGEIGGRRADGFVGAWLRTGDLDSNFFVNLRGARGAPTSRTLQNADAVDVFGEGRLFVTDQLALVAGATAGRATRAYRSFAAPGAPATFDLTATREYEWVAPRVGLLWEAPDGLQAFANLTRSVEPPNFGSLSPTNAGFASVKAQRAWTAEVGTRGRRGPVTFDLVYYRAALEGELLQFTVGEGIPASTFNADETTHQGVEAAVDWRFQPGWRLRQTYTWSDFRFENDTQYGDNRLPIVPEHFYRAELRYEHPGGWFVAPSLEWSAGELWVDYANMTRLPSYAIFNVNAGLNLTDAVAVFAEVRNLEDESYVSNVQAQIAATATSAAYWPGDGRSIYGGLTWSF
jgi:iron complex outermembrane receptor protein